MKKLLLTGFITGAGFLAIATASYADVNERMKDSKYCRNNSRDIICMGPESLKERAEMMAMTKEKAAENRSMYCRDGQANDPICETTMMNDMTGY